VVGEEPGAAGERRAVGDRIGANARVRNGKCLPFGPSGSVEYSSENIRWEGWELWCEGTLRDILCEKSRLGLQMTKAGLAGNAVVAEN